MESALSKLVNSRDPSSVSELRCIIEKLSRSLPAMPGIFSVMAN